MNEEPYLRTSEDDIHVNNAGAITTNKIEFKFVFSGRSEEEEADFLPAQIPNNTQKHIGCKVKGQLNFQS